MPRTSHPGIPQPEQLVALWLRSAGQAASPEPPLGRFQIAGIPGHAYVLDTATGQVWERFDSAGGGSSDQDFKQPKLKGKP